MWTTPVSGLGPQPTSFTNPQLSYSNPQGSYPNPYLQTSLGYRSQPFEHTKDCPRSRSVQYCRSPVSCVYNAIHFTQGP